MPLEIDGVLHPVSQCNNMYLFPGLARGAWLGRTGNVTDSMLMAAAEAVPTLIAEADVRAGLPYPRLKVGAGELVACGVARTCV
jgi:malic enzyme